MRSLRGLLTGALAALAAVMPVAAIAQPLPKQIEQHIAAAKATMMTDQAMTLREVAQIEALAKQQPEGRERTIALATALWLGGEALLRSNAPDKAAPLLAQGLLLINKIDEPIKLRGDLLLSRGALFMQRDEAASALESFQQAYYIFKQVKEPRSQAISYQNLATLYWLANDHEKAEQYLREATELYRGDPMLSLSLHNTRGNVLLGAERYAEAEAEHLEAAKIARSRDNPLLEARVLVNLAREQVNMQKFAEAERTLARGFKLISGAKAPPMLRRHLLATSARMAADRGNYPRAAQLIRQAFRGVDLKKTSIDYRNAHLYAHEIFSKVGDPQLALAHLEALKRLTDEAAKVATSTNAALMAARFDSAGQQAKIATLRAEQVERDARFQRTLFLSIGAATLVVIAALAWGLVSIFRSRNKVRASNVVLNRTNAALEKALKAKTEFLATTSHEIRTPLNGILGMTQVMLRDSQLDERMRDRIGIVHSAGVTMRSLVDDILDVAKMENGNLTIEASQMDLCATLQEVTRLWEEQARGKDLNFVLRLEDAPRWIVSDAGRLRQIVFNLLSNAIKFTEAGEVSVTALAEGEGEGRRLKLRIADSGIGIPPDKCEEIFESFKQADSGTTRKFGGTGLGLTICRNLAQALGGDVSVESVEGEGSVFIVDLPLILADAPETEAAGDASGALLVLDRNPISRAMLRTLFEPHFGTVRFVATPDEAVAAIEEGGGTHLLIDEMTVKAAGDDVAAILAPLGGAAANAGLNSSILWLEPDESLRGTLAAAGIGQVIEKPIAGAALVQAIVPVPKENSDKGTPGALVSRAA